MGHTKLICIVMTRPSLITKLTLNFLFKIFFKTNKFDNTRIMLIPICNLNHFGDSYMSFESFAASLAMGILLLYFI